MSLLICIPTVQHRQPYLANAIAGYVQRTRDEYGNSIELHFSIITDAESCGEGWNRCVAQGLEWWPETSLIHFSNDDVVPATNWLGPLAEAVEKDCIPCSRIEPAGGHIAEDIFQTHPPMPPDYFPVPRDKMAYFYADLPELQPREDWQQITRGNLPFCSREQWERIGRFPPIHYFTDHWFYHRAMCLGMKVVARQDSVFFNYNANIGRSKGTWTEQDFLDFDGVFAYPAYENGDLQVDEEHPLRRTSEGLEMARAWRKQHLARSAS